MLVVRITVDLIHWLRVSLSSDETFVPIYTQLTVQPTSDQIVLYYWYILAPLRAKRRLPV